MLTLFVFVKEEPIKRSEVLKNWIAMWKKHFQNKENKHLLKIFTCFWNAPEGSVSVLLEPVKKGSLQVSFTSWPSDSLSTKDILNLHISLPETAIQQVTMNLVKGVHEVHTHMKSHHGAVTPSEIFFDSACQLKVHLPTTIILTLIHCIAVPWNQLPCKQQSSEFLWQCAEYQRSRR